MKYTEFKREIDFNRENPEEYNYYLVGFDGTVSMQEFINLVYQTIPEIQGLWCHRAGSVYYTALKKPDVLPENFAPYIEIVEFDSDPIQEEVTE